MTILKSTKDKQKNKTDSLKRNKIGRVFIGRGDKYI